MSLLDLFGIHFLNRYKRIFIVLFLMLLAVGVGLGIPQVYYGHLGRHPMIWELLPFITSFNPLLGIGLWLGFVVGDTATKTIGPATGNLGHEYWSILYLTMLLFALIPALLGRLIARWSHRFLSKRFASPAGDASPHGTLYDGGRLVASAMTSLTPPMLQAIVAGISSAALAGVLLPTMVDGIWRSVYLDMGDDPSCFAIATSDINHHATSSTLASGLGGSSGGFVEESSRSGGAPLSKLGLITGSALSPGTRPPARIQHTHKKQSRRKRLLRWQNYKLNARQKAAREHAINVWLKYGGFLPTEIMLPYGIERELKRLQALRTETAERASSWTHLGYAAWFVGGVLTIAGGLAGGALGSVPGAKVGAELGSLVGGVIGGLVGGCSASRIQQEGAYIEELVAKIDKRIRALKAEIQKRKDKVLEQHLQNLYRRSGR